MAHSRSEIRRKTFTSALLSGVCVLGGVALLSACVSGGPTQPETIPVGDYSYAREVTEHLAVAAMEQHGLPSIAVALIDGQQVVHAEAFGLSNVESGEAATTNTIYKMWSVSKVFTAMEVVRLADEGEIDLDAPVSIPDHLPGFSVQSRFGPSQPITIRHLLTHTSGLPRSGCIKVPDDVDGYRALEVLVDSIDDCYLAYPTGDRYHYSNLGVDILGRIVEMIRGTRYPEYMRTEVLLPLGMERSGFHSIQMPRNAKPAMGYEFYKGEFYPYHQYDVASFPSGNLHSTVDELARYVQFLLRNDTLSRMFEEQPGRSTGSQPMGLGWKLGTLGGSDVIAWHDGGPSEGIGSIIALLPERELGVVLVANEISFDGSVSLAIAAEILEVMVETKFGPTVAATQPEEPLTTPEPDNDLLESYEGTYVVFGTIMDVRRRGRRLVARVEGMNLDLIPTSSDEFSVSHWLVRTGLSKLIPVPVDLDELSVSFLPPHAHGPASMVIVSGGIAHERGDRYPDLTEIPTDWVDLLGQYERHFRTGTRTAGVEAIGEATIVFTDGILSMSGVMGPILSIEDDQIVIVGGPFAGETMEYERATGRIYHQNHVYVGSVVPSSIHG